MIAIPERFLMAARDLFIMHFPVHELAALESASSISQWQTSLHDKRHVYI